MTIKRRIALGISATATGVVSLAGLLGVVPLNRQFNTIEFTCNIVMLIVLAPVVVNMWPKK